MESPYYILRLQGLCYNISKSVINCYNKTNNLKVRAAENNESQDCEYI